MNFLIPLLFLIYSLGQLGRVSFLNQTINTYLYEIILFIFLLRLIYTYKLKPIKEAYKKFKYLYIFTAILFLSFVLSIWNFNLTDNTIAFLYLKRLVFYFLFFVYLIYGFGEQKKLPILYKRSFVIFAIITAFTSILQYFLYPNLRNISYLGWDPHEYRVFGVFFDTGLAAAILGMVLLYFLFRHQKIYAGIFAVLGLYTYSRGFYVAIAVALIYHLIRKKKPVLIAVFALVFGILLFSLPRPAGESANLLRMFTISARTEDYKKAIDVASRSPLLGIGYNRIRNYKIAQSTSHAGASFHSSFLILLATTGIIGLVFFILFLIQLSKISYFSQIYLIFLSTFSLFDNILLHPFILFIMFGLLAYESVQKKVKVSRI